MAIGGPTTGIAQTSHTFTATVNPVAATVPVTYIWQATGQLPVTHTGALTDTAAFTWSVTGSKAITVAAANGAGMVTDTHVITVYEPVQADFIASPSSGVAPLTVAFTNTSSGDCTASLWDFGDEVTSTLRNPSHTYTEAGLYTVTLTVSTTSGMSATVTRPNYINTVPMVMMPYSTTAYISETFEVTITVQAGSQPIDGAEAHLDFDPTLLEVIDLAGGSALPTGLQNQFDNDAGTVDYSAGMLVGTPPTGTFTLATIRFHAITETRGVTLPFVFTAPRKTDLVFEGQSVLGGHRDGHIKVEAGASISGMVDLQGRPVAPDPSWSIPLTLTLHPPEGGEPTYIFTPTTDNTGTFSVSDITPGVYTATVKNVHTLRNRKVITLASGPNAISFGTLLEGDVNDDNCVNITDFSLLRTAFATCEGDEEFDPGTDFNEDGCVNISDFSLLRTNFGLCGDIDVTAAGVMKVAGGAGTVSISIVPHTKTIAVGQVFTLAIQLGAGSQPVDGAEAHLDFDPTYLRVVNAAGVEVDEITEVATTLDTVLQNEVDNREGTIDYATGVLVGEPPTGTITLASIRLKAITETMDTGLSFVFTDTRKTDVVFEGASVLGEHTDGNVAVIAYRNKVFLPLVLRE